MRPGRGEDQGSRRWFARTCFGRVAPAGRPALPLSGDPSGPAGAARGRSFWAIAIAAAGRDVVAAESVRAYVEAGHRRAAGS